MNSGPHPNLLLLVTAEGKYRQHRLCEGRGDRCLGSGCDCAISSYVPFLDCAFAYSSVKWVQHNSTEFTDDSHMVLSTVPDISQMFNKVCITDYSISNISVKQKSK